MPKSSSDSWRTKAVENRAGADLAGVKNVDCFADQPSLILGNSVKQRSGKIATTVV